MSAAVSAVDGGAGAGVALPSLLWNPPPPPPPPLGGGATHTGSNHLLRAIYSAQGLREAVVTQARARRHSPL